MLGCLNHTKIVLKFIIKITAPVGCVYGEKEKEKDHQKGYKW